MSCQSQVNYLRIGVVSHNYPPHPGGLEVIAEELTRGFAQRGHEVTVVTTAWNGNQGVTEEDGVVVHRLLAWHGAERRGVPYALPLGPGLLRATAALRQCDVIHAHGSLYATTLLGLLFRRSAVPLIVTEHVGFVQYTSRTLNTIQSLAWALIGNLITRRAARVITYNVRVGDWIARRFGAAGVTLIPNGVDTKRFQIRGKSGRRDARRRLGLPLEEVLALFVGRAAPKKNLEALMESLKTGTFRLVVCGAARELPSHVINLGLVPYKDMPDVFAAADLIVHPATGEGFPVAIQEGMASGLPVVLLWDAGYLGSLSRDAVVAVDSLSNLSSVAQALASDELRRAELGSMSREFAVKNWSWEVTTDRHLELFHQARREQ